jgi:hypothetical protein
MTVKELVEYLRTLPDKAEVEIVCRDERRWLEPKMLDYYIRTECPACDDPDCTWWKNDGVLTIDWRHRG